MKHLFEYKLLIICLFCLYSCKEDVELVDVNIDRQSAMVSSSEESHLIPIEKALNTLQCYLEGTTDCTRANTPPYDIEDIITIKSKSTSTRSLEGDTDANLLYVVNFQDEQGFAVLAADDRISDPIIAITEMGRLDSSDFGVDDDKRYNDSIGRPIFEGYPTTGPGLFYDDNYPGEVFLNPNTFELYDEDVDDYYVGDYISDDYPDFDSDNNAKLIGQLCFNYAENEIKSPQEPQHPSDPIPLVPRDTIYPYDSLSYHSTYSDTIIVTNQIAPLLDLFKNWKQSPSPYNDLCPTVRLFIWPLTKKKASVGCVPLAISKIMSFHRYPNLSYNSYPIAWDNIVESPSTNTERYSIAALFRCVGLGCNSIYFYSGTFTFPKYAKEYLEDCFYKNVEYCDYSTDKVIESLNNFNPLFICSIPNYINITKSHGWNIDGYKITVTQTTIKRYKNNVCIDEATINSQPITKVHCDFGWSGLYNGYYTSGVFNLNDRSQIEFDNRDNLGKEYNFNNFIKIITCSKQ